MSGLLDRLAEREAPKLESRLESRLESSPADAAWLVLEAASDLGDEAAVTACRRVIDANLNGRPADLSDLNFVQNYFR
jgi:hypothetical protein